MSVYVTIFTILAALAALEIATESPRLRRVFPLAVAALVLFAGLRGDGVGFDYDSYEDIFDAAISDDAEGVGLIEPAFRWLMVAVGRLGGFHLLLFVVAALSLGMKSFFIGRYSPYLYTGLLIYYSIALLMNDMGQIRYGLAMGVVLVAFHRRFRGGRWTGLALCLVAVMVHYSALLVLPALLVVDRRISGRAMVVALLCAALFYVVSINDLLQLASRLIPVPHIQGKISFYTTLNDTYGRPLGLNVSLLLRLLVLLFFYRHRAAIAELMPAAPKLLNLYLYGVLLYMVFNSNAEFATRGSGYFKILEVAMMPAFVAAGRGAGNRLLIWACVAAYALYSITKLLAEGFGAEAYLNYHNLLF